MPGAEQVSSAAGRNLLAAALEYVREGDAPLATRLDRPARSIADLMATWQALDRRTVGPRVLDPGMDWVYPYLWR